MSIAFWRGRQCRCTPWQHKRDAYPYVPNREFAVFRVALLRQGHAQVRIDVGHHLARGRQVLEEEEHQRELVEQIDAEDDAPERGVGSDEGAIPELDHRE